jgi:REP element-mobilizing transposase RayT
VGVQRRKRLQDHTMTQHPLVIGYHLVWTAYGWWLPNDPRGSGSHTVHTDVLAELGELHLGRKKVQPAGREVRQFYEQAAALLKHPLLKFDEAERTVIGEAFGEVIAREKYTCYACVVIPDHVHLLIRKHKHTAEEMGWNLMDASRAALVAAGRRDPTHPTWVGGTPWSVFLDHPDEIRRTVTYIEKNPLPLRLPVQRWPFVTPYDNWPLHPGHSPNSPYAKRLREVGRYP